MKIDQRETKKETKPIHNPYKMPRPELQTSHRLRHFGKLVGFFCYMNIHNTYEARKWICAGGISSHTSGKRERETQSTYLSAYQIQRSEFTQGVSSLNIGIMCAWRERKKEREREREREREIEIERESVCVRERERKREREKDTERSIFVNFHL